MATKAIVSDTTAYAAIVKFEEQEDGTVLAYGKATDATLDADEQICDPEWLKRAMPEWFKYGNIREQHSSVAAGVATEYEETEDGHYITAHIVDPSSAKKIKTGVLKGFSIGIRRPRVIKDNKAAGGRIIDGQIVEISVVDRPANPSCMLTVAKASKGELKAVKSVFTELTKGDPDQPRDENGRFASSDGGDSDSGERVQGGNRGELAHGGLTDKVNELANRADTEESQMLARESASYMEQAARAEDDEKHLDLTYAAAERLHEASSYELTRGGKEAMRDAADEIENYVSRYDKSVRPKITKGSEDQPRDENGRFASSDGGGSDFARRDDGSMEATANMEQAEEAVAELRGFVEENQMEIEMGISSVADYVDYQDDNDPHAEPLGRLSESVSTANSKIENSASEPANVASALMASAASDLQIARTIANQQSRVGSQETRTAFSNLSESIGNQINTVNALDEQYRSGYIKSIATKENIMQANAILKMSKEWAGSDIKKFDQTAFDNARRALATLIQVEAGEMAEGHSEAHSLTSLLSAVHALMEYSEGEVAEGETMFMSEMKMADKPEKAMAEEEMCPECEKSMKECACETGKCLECGCHEPANNHGRDDVTTAVVVRDKSQVSDIQTMVEDIVKELLTNPSVGEEITTKAAESERIQALETELAQVKSLAAPSGPKRFAAVSNTTANVNKTKAAIYRAKAATTLDKSLANGYLALAIDLEKSESQ